MGYFPGASLVSSFVAASFIMTRLLDSFLRAVDLFLAGLEELVEYFLRKEERWHTFSPRASLSWTLGLSRD